MFWAIATINKGIGAWPAKSFENMSFDELYRWYDLAVEILDAEAEREARENHG